MTAHNPEAWLATRGLNLPPRPNTPEPHVLIDPEGRHRHWPADLSSVGDDELAAWQASLAAWVDYAESLLGTVKGARAVAIEHAESAEAVATVEAIKQGHNVTAAKAVARVDEVVRDARLASAVAEAQYQAASGRAKGIDARKMAVAQEIKRRTAAMGPQMRGQDGRRG